MNLPHKTNPPDKRLTRLAELFAELGVQQRSLDHWASEHAETLAAGASYTWDPETAWGPSATDAWNSCFLVDSMGDVDESNESDNLACFDVAPW